MNDISQNGTVAPATINWESPKERRMFMADVRRAAIGATDEAIQDAFEKCQSIHSTSSDRKLLMACTLRRLIPSS